MSYSEILERGAKSGRICKRYQGILGMFYEGYCRVLKERQLSVEPFEDILSTYLELIVEQLDTPHEFKEYHPGTYEPVDLYHLGLDVFRPLVDSPHSALIGSDQLIRIQQQLADGDNVIFLANHQTEAEPQLISLLLEKDFPSLAKDMIFVSGARVLTDPLATPMSIGRTLLCIHSKRHLGKTPEELAIKRGHNQKTMSKLTRLLAEGGQCIYVAPSGGRDRPDSNGVIQVADFDSDSVETFMLIAKRSKQPTHFYPMALATNAILPPPDEIEEHIGEQRRLYYAPIAMAIGEKLSIENLTNSSLSDKKKQRLQKTASIMNLVKNLYAQCLEALGPRSDL